MNKNNLPAEPHILTLQELYNAASRMLRIKDEERHADHDHSRGQEHWRPRLCVRCVDWRGLRLGKQPDPDRY